MALGPGEPAVGAAVETAGLQTPLPGRRHGTAQHHRLVTIGTVQLEKLDFIVNERRKIARKYDAEFCKFPHLRLIKEPENVMWNYQSYCLCVNSDSTVKRDTILNKLRKAGIDSREGISSIHKLNPYREKHGDLNLPITENYSNNSILLPIYYPMSDNDIDYIIEKVLSCISNF